MCSLAEAAHHFDLLLTVGVELRAVEVVAVRVDHGAECSGSSAHFFGVEFELPEGYNLCEVAVVALWSGLSLSGFESL